MEKNLLKEDLDYFDRGNKENKKFWDRLGGKPDLSDKNVLDFGSGHGSMCIDAIKAGAKKVVGIDIEPYNVNFANINLFKNFSIYKDKVSFRNVNLLEWEDTEKFDVIFSKDSFEHTFDIDKILHEMKNKLNDGGKIYLGFGPLYNFYNGDHGRARAVLPWFHLIIPENYLINKINKERKIKINSIEELGLNKYSFKEYQYIFENCGLEIEYFKTNITNHPIAIFFRILSKIKLFKEYCTFNIYCILKKKNKSK